MLTLKIAHASKNKVYRESIKQRC